MELTILKKINSIECKLNEIAMLSKKVLNFKEAMAYLGLSKSTLYKHTHNMTVPCYKPNGKLIYFKREELDDWMLSNKQKTHEGIKQKASNFRLKSGRA